VRIHRVTIAIAGSWREEYSALLSGRQHSRLRARAAAAAARAAWECLRGEAEAGAGAEAKAEVGAEVTDGEPTEGEAAEAALPLPPQKQAQAALGSALERLRRALRSIDADALSLVVAALQRDADSGAEPCAVAARVGARARQARGAAGGSEEAAATQGGEGAVPGSAGGRECTCGGACRVLRSVGGSPPLEGAAGALDSGAAGGAAHADAVQVEVKLLAAAGGVPDAAAATRATRGGGLAAGYCLRPREVGATDSPWAHAARSQGHLQALAKVGSYAPTLFRARAHSRT
jgi:hypothetical protein